MTPNNLHHHRCWQPRRNLHHTKGLTLAKVLHVSVRHVENSGIPPSKEQILDMWDALIAIFSATKELCDA
jgi:hypothetical protein